MGHFNRFIITGIAFLTLTAFGWADRMDSPITTDVIKTQHFRKYVFSNSSSVPVTVKVKVTGDNLKINKRMPHSFVVPGRSKREAFQTSAKDPRTYYGDPTLDQEYAVGDYRISRSNLPLVAPCTRGKSLKVKDVSKAGTVTFEADKGSQVTCARQGLVVRVEDGAVWVGHNDGSVSRYRGLDSISATLNKELGAGQPVGTVAEEEFEFELAVPTQSLDYRAIPSHFRVNGAKAAPQAGGALSR